MQNAWLLLSVGAILVFLKHMVATLTQSFSYNFYCALIVQTTDTNI